MRRRAFGWWLFAESLGERLTEPRIDVRTADRGVERMVVESWLGSLDRRAARSVRAAWQDSWCRSRALALAGDWRAPGRAVRLRAAGWAMTVAAVTTLIVQRLGAGRVEPGTRILPTVAAAGGLVLWWLARRRPDQDERHAS